MSNKPKHEHGYHGRSYSVAMLMRRAKARAISSGDLIWDAMNTRFVRAHHRWKTRYERQRQHAIHLEQLLREKNLYIQQLRADLDRVQDINESLEDDIREVHHQYPPNVHAK